MSVEHLIPYKPGQTGNPGGWSKDALECRRLAREASPAAMRRLIELAGISGNPELAARRVADQITALDKILNRALGLPKQTVEYEGDTPSIASITVNFVNAMNDRAIEERLVRATPSNWVEHTGGGNGHG